VHDTLVNIQLSTKTGVQLINNEVPIILPKGERLQVKISNSESIPTVVRIHSSLGRLVKEFTEVNGQISMPTDKLLPGIYLIIIKQDALREVRKLVLTD
jgi:hypothetical protein